MTDKLSEYGWSFQIKVLAAMFVDRTFLQQIADIIQSDYFESDANSWLLDILIEHFREYKTPPSKDVLKVKVTEIDNDVLKTAILEQLKDNCSEKYIPNGLLFFVIKFLFFLL